MPTPSGQSFDPPSGRPPDASPAPSSAASLLRDAARRLLAIEAGNPRLEAEYLLAAALRCERIDLYRRDASEPVPREAVADFASLLGRRLAREPLQYVLGTIPFGGLELVIGPGALIPRGETEVLVEEVAQRLIADPPGRAIPGVRDAADGRTDQGQRSRPPVLIDVGTGSGAILLALLARLPGWRGLGIDRSAVALSWAAKNARRAGRKSGATARAGAGPNAAGRTDANSGSAARAGATTVAHLPLLVRGDLLGAVRDGSVAAVVSNPPYIRSAEMASLAPEIRDHEPIEALDGGEDGLDAVRRLILEAARALVCGGLLALELAPDQPEAAARIVESTGSFEPPEVFADLAGRRRGIVARKRHARYSLPGRFEF